MGSPQKSEDGSEKKKLSLEVFRKSAAELKL
jgi:hypothetical protein